MNMHDFCDSRNSARAHFGPFSSAPHSWPPGCLPRTNPSCLRWLGSAGPQVQKVEGPAPSSECARRGLCVTARGAAATSGSGRVPGPSPPQGPGPGIPAETSGPASAPVLGPGPLAPGRVTLIPLLVITRSSVKWNTWVSPEVKAQLHPSGPRSYDTREWEERAGPRAWVRRATKPRPPVPS